MGDGTVNFGWIGNGRYVEADGPEKSACMVVFRNIRERNVALRLEKLDGKGNPGIAGIQLVPSAMLLRTSESAVR